MGDTHSRSAMVMRSSVSLPSGSVIETGSSIWCTSVASPELIP